MFFCLSPWLFSVPSVVKPKPKPATITAGAYVTRGPPVDGWIAE
jgi:hypothetical protein